MLAHAMSSTIAVTPNKQRDGRRGFGGDPALAVRARLDNDRLRLEARHRLLAHVLLERHLDLVDDAGVERRKGSTRLFDCDPGLSRANRYTQ